MINTKNESFNVASYLVDMAAKIPNKTAVLHQKFNSNSSPHLTFLQLNSESSRYARGMQKMGIQKGDRALVMVKPGLEFVALTFALFKIGAVPVLIDPGMGLSNLLNCVKQVTPKVFIAIPLAHVVRILNKKYFSSVKHCITVGRRFFWKGNILSDVREKQNSDFRLVETVSYDPAAILFTTGSTGIPKGVLYQHGMFAAQVNYIKSYYGIGETDVDMPVFPLFALFSAALGMTCIIPDMNPTKPARVNPEVIIDLITKYKVTTSFGSPSLWDRVGKYCLKNNIQLPSIKRILMAGAPVRGYVMERFEKILSKEADIHTPYGATEALPLVSITAKERKLLDKKSREGAGTCVGRALPGITIKIIKAIKDPIKSWDDSFILDKGEKGEIAAKGNVVTHEYFGMEDHTALAKIRDGNAIWHRMGDIGYFDEDSRLWFCGRKAHCVHTKNGTMYPIPCEAIFNQHPDVFRSAIVGIGSQDNQIPVIIIEPKAGKMPRISSSRKKFTTELLNTGKRYEHTKDIKYILFHSSFPVDIRHNIKISREKLAVWAEKSII